MIRSLRRNLRFRANLVLLVVFAVLFVEALALAWANDHASCVRSNDVRSYYNLRGAALDQHLHVRLSRLPLLDCDQVVPGS